MPVNLIELCSCSPGSFRWKETHVGHVINHMMCMCCHLQWCIGWSRGTLLHNESNAVVPKSNSLFGAFSLCLGQFLLFPRKNTINNFGPNRVYFETGWETIQIVFLVQVRLRAEVTMHPISTLPGFKLMTSRSWQYISCHWDATVLYKSSF